MTKRNAAFVALGILSAASVIGCAQMTADNATPQARCVNFARHDGLAVADVLAVNTVANGHEVRLRLDDGLGRKFEATCTTAGGPRWTQPLPANVVRSNVQLSK